MISVDEAKQKLDEACAADNEVIAAIHAATVIENDALNTLLAIRKERAKPKLDPATAIRLLTEEETAETAHATAAKKAAALQDLRKTYASAAERATVVYREACQVANRPAAAKARAEALANLGAFAASLAHVFAINDGAGIQPHGEGWARDFFDVLAKHGVSDRFGRK